MGKDLIMEDQTPQEENQENHSREDDKNSNPSPPQSVTPDGAITPNLTDVPEDDSAEPEDAGVDHLATEEEVEESS
jgi:hypothetical protein